ncbi:MAG: LysR family transcriptional regulator [Gammaproteobacteria bacterium]|nr:LysR family transcriptional regulator [Gammaproteobacteria bacterium]
MQLRQLRYFLAVVEHGSFSRAAEELGRTQQALSKGIQALEDSLGVRLLDRNPRTATPTVFGQLLLGPARNVDVELRGFGERLNEMLGVQHGHVRIGASPTAAGLLLADAVGTLKTRFPEVTLTVSTGIHGSLLQALVGGDVDLCVSVETQDTEMENVVREVLCHEDYRIIAAGSHPLARRAVRASDLQSQRWVRGRNLGVVEQAFTDSFSTLGLQLPAAAMETDSLEFTREMLLAGDCLCILPTDLVARELESGLLVTLEVPGFRWLRPISLYYRRTTPPGPAALALIGALHAAAHLRAA